MAVGNVGDTVEAAIWLDGKETFLGRLRFVREVEDAMRQAQGRHGHVLSPVRWTEKKPLDDRVPPVPDHIQGPNVRLLVAEAEITAKEPIKREVPGFCHDLEADDLARLRKITRREYERAYPGRPRLTNRQCDTLINDLGPEVAVDTLRKTTPSDMIGLQ